VTRPERDFVVGLALLGLLSGALAGRAGSSLARMFTRSSPAARASVRIEPAGLFGIFVGRVSEVAVAGSGVGVDRLDLGPTSGSSRAPIRVRSTNVRLADSVAFGAPVRRLRLAQRDVRLDGVALITRGDAAIVSVGGGVADAQIEAATLERLVEARVRTLRNVRVAAGGRVLTVEGDSLFPRGRFTTQIEVEVRNGMEVVAVRPRVHVNGQELSESAATAMVAAVNPLFTLADAPGWAKGFAITDVTVGEGVVRLAMTRAGLPWRQAGQGTQ